MDFSFDDEQLALRHTVRDLLTRECPSSVVRAAWEDDTGRSGDAWERLREVGVLTLAAPEPDGFGLGMVDLVLSLEEAGHAALPDPIVEHAAVAAPIAGLDGITDGTVTAVAPGTDVVPWADSATTILILDDETVRAVAPASATLTPLETVDGARRLCRVDAADAAPVATDAAAAFDRGALGTSAVLVGLGQHLLDVTVAYTSERRQFGVPVGSFQAIKHHLADVAIALEFARPHVHRAAHSLDLGDPGASPHVSMAKAAASDAAELAARAALQCHGAIGYSNESDLHLWLKRVWALAPTWGDPAWHRERVARAILDP